MPKFEAGSCIRKHLVVTIWVNHTILFFVVCVSLEQQKFNTDNKKLYDKTQIVTWRFCMQPHAPNFGIQFLSRNTEAFNS